MYLPKGYSRSPYKYNKIIKNSIFLLSLDSADLSGAHTHKIQVLPFLTAPSPLTGLGKNLSSQFKLPVVMQTVGCSGSVPGLGNTSQQANTATQKRSWFRGKQNTRDRKSLDQVCTHAACRPAEPHLQLGTIFKEAPSLIKNPTLRVKRRKGLLSCFFSSLCLKKKSSIFQWKVPEPGLEPTKGVPPTAGSLTSSQQAPGLGQSPTRRGEQLPRVSSRSARTGHSQVSTLSSLSQGHLGQKEVTSVE